ncbi:MAG: VOC family protein [Paracoccaceae bacterium]
MSFTPYLSFDGTCAEALNFYAEIFGGEARIAQTVAQSPMAAQFDAEQQGLVMHGELHVGACVLMASDSLMGPYTAPAGFHIQMDYDDPDKAKRVFDRLAKHGQVRMEFAQTFFSPGFGMCVDRYGTPWMIVCSAEAH